jgi:hypothetical protein
MLIYKLVKVLIAILISKLLRICIANPVITETSTCCQLSNITVVIDGFGASHVAPLT